MRTKPMTAYEFKWRMDSALIYAFRARWAEMAENYKKAREMRLLMDQEYSIVNQAAAEGRIQGGEKVLQNMPTGAGVEGYIRVSANETWGAFLAQPVQELLEAGQAQAAEPKAHDARNSQRWY